MSMFINRKDENEKLQEIYRSKKAELVLVYGRRRIGKSRLLIESIKNKDAVYFLADASDNILDILSQQIKDEFVKFSNWEDFFEFMLKSKHTVFIIDEFQYLYQVNKAWPTILQRWWEKLKDTDKKIILCGSIISTIDKIARGYGSALYGRKTYEMEIQPLSFQHAREFLKGYPVEEQIKAYSVLGGIPRYLEEIDLTKSVEENINEKILEKIRFLYNEPVNLLFEEFRDPSTYLAILSGISEGQTKFNEIAVYSHIGTNKLPKYLLVLERVGIIKKEVPVTEKKLKSKLTRYYLKDNFYRFWLRFVFKNKAQIEQGLNKELGHAIKKELPSYMGNAFEEVCKETLLLKLHGITKLGRWWHKDTEIDIVAINETNDTIYFAECKWKDGVDAEQILAELREKAKQVSWRNNKRKEKFIIIGKSFAHKIHEQDVILMGIDDIKNAAK